MQDNRPAWRLCPWNELIETAKALAPVVNREAVIRLEIPSFDSMRDVQNAIGILHVNAVWLIGGIFNEMQHRETISDDQYTKEWDETHRHVMAVLEKRLAELEPVPDGEATPCC